MEKIDLLITDVQVFNSYFKKFTLANVAILNGRIFYVDTKQETAFSAAENIDGAGKFMIPGLVDIHMHIESSMMTPEPFCQRVAECGVTTIVTEPHEIANVKGIEGIEEMINAGKAALIDVYYAIPSSVPSTSPDLETTGAILNFAEMKSLLNNDKVICIGEVMNYRQIIKENNLEITKLLTYLREHKLNYIIEGHCPALIDLDLAKFLYLGINGDHTEHSIEEIEQRIANGMFMEIQEKTLTADLIAYIEDNRLYEHIGFVTDDKMADDLQETGHLNTLITKAVRLGMRVEDAIYCASYTNARRMNLTDRGAIVPGKLADFALLADLQSFNVTETYKGGNLIYQSSTGGVANSKFYQFPQDFYHSVKVKALQPEQFNIFVPEDCSEVTVNVIEVSNGTTRTQKKAIVMPVVNHQLIWQDSGCLLGMVVERYGKNGNIGYGFFTGACITVGAVATTYFHDHHNLFILGKDIASMITAQNRILDLQGGIVTAKDARIIAELPLPIAGILSDWAAPEIGKALKQVRSSLCTLGYRHNNPIMSLCTLGLPVSPALKITDKGIVDVYQSQIEPLYYVK